MKIDPNLQTVSTQAARKAAPREEAPAVPADVAELTSKRRGTTGNEVYPLMSGEQVLQGAVAAMKEAKSGIRVEMYRMGHEKLVGVLAEQARNGIDVQVLLDPSVYDEEHRVRRDQMVDFLKTSGVDVGFYPIPEKERRIDHVKLLIVDNKYALLSGMNWDSHSPENLDQGAMLRGPAVGEMNAIFENDWQIAGGTVKPLPAPPPLPEKPEPFDGKLPIDRDAAISFATTKDKSDPNPMRSLIVDRLNSAKKSIYMEAFALADKEVLQALSDAAARGVDVRVLLDPNKPIVFQNRKSAEILEKAGVKVRWTDVDLDTEEKDHSKMAIVDDEATILGSANFTYAGLTFNHEASAEVVSKAVGSAFSKLFLSRWDDKSVARPPELPNYQERIPEEPAAEQWAKEIFRGFTDYHHPDARRNWVGKRKEAILEALEEHRGQKDLKAGPREDEETTIGKLAAFFEARGLAGVKPEPGTQDALWTKRLEICREAAPGVGEKAAERREALAAAVKNPALAEVVRRAHDLAPRGYALAPADYKPDRFPADSLRPGDLDYKPDTREKYSGGGRILADRRAQVAAEHLSDFFGLTQKQKDEVQAALAVRSLALGVTAADMRAAKDPRQLDWKPWEADKDRQAASALLEKLGLPAARPLRELLELTQDGPPPEADRRHQVMYFALRLSEAPNFYIPA